MLKKCQHNVEEPNLYGPCMYIVYMHTCMNMFTSVVVCWIDCRVGGRGTVCLSHVVLGDYIIHISMRCIWEGMQGV